MPTYSKQLLSGSTNGKGIFVTANGTASPTLLHTAPAGTTSLDEVYLYACNMAPSNGTVAILWGGTVFPDDITATTVTQNSGRNLLVDGRLINNGLSITVYSNGTGMVMDGFVNRITA